MNKMDTQEILALYDKEQRIEIEFPGMQKEVLPQVVRFVRPGTAGMNFVMHSRLDETNVEAAIVEQVAYFSQWNQPFEWKVYDHDTPPDLKDRLVAHGFEPEDPDAIMVLDLQTAPTELLQPITADIRPITHRAQLEDVIRVEQQVWGGKFDWMRDRLGGHLEIPGYLSLYLAYVDNEPACVGWTYFYPNSHFAGLWGGSTVEKYRKRGLYTGVLAIRVQEAIQRGYRYLTIDASDMSRPIVTSHGFQLLTMAHACKFPRNSNV